MKSLLKFALEIRTHLFLQSNCVFLKEFIYFYQTIDNEVDRAVKDYQEPAKLVLESSLSLSAKLYLKRIPCQEK